MTAKKVSLLLTLTVVLAAATTATAVAAVPTHTQDWPRGLSPGPVVATGVLGAPFTRAPDPEPIYALTDEGFSQSFRRVLTSLLR